MEVSTMNLEIGIAIAILLHFGAVVWWGSRLTTEMKSMRETVNRIASVMEIQQNEIRELYTRVAVQDAVLKATRPSFQGGGTQHADRRTAGEGTGAR